MSVGSNAVVSSTHPYRFGAGGYFFGNGPVYVGLAWRPADRAEARFKLVDRMPRVSEGYRLKTPWIMDPKYQGAALVRGARIGSVESGRILFQGPETRPALVLRSKFRARLFPRRSLRKRHTGDSGQRAWWYKGLAAMCCR